jgi:ABC-type multidrug transport system permease subunit
MLRLLPFKQIPYLFVSSLSFTLPFFYIIGFDYTGDTNERFFWYWFLNFLLQATMIFISELFVALTPNEQTSQGKHRIIRLLLFFL